MSSGIQTTFWEALVDKGICCVHAFERGTDEECKCPGGGVHFAQRDTGEMSREQWNRREYGETEQQARQLLSKCDHCGHVFKSPSYGSGWRPVYRNEATGEITEANKLPPGASYFADWFERPEGREPGDNTNIGPDGKSLVVVLPDGTHWHVDSRACNCTKKDDKVHKCWVRTGDPRQCNVDVGKGGITCDAGAGSIQTSKWHGFLRNGVLVIC